MSEQKILKRWIDNDPEIKEQRYNFTKWFKSFCDRGGRIGQEIDKRRGAIYLLDSREFLVLKKFYLGREKGWSK